MSGIVGIYYPNGKPVEREQLKRMVDTLAHRGPDGKNIWYEDNLGLGHLMLHTTPESLQEELPYVDRSENFVITADARIDNRDQLIPLLNLNRRPSIEVSDSQLILEAYKRWGDKCPEKLLGDFIFAIWDKQKQELFCARDHFGVKPIYYYSSRQIFAFGSEIKAILASRKVPRKLNEVRIADYLASIFEDKAITFYQDIFRLPPAHSLSVTVEGITLKPYWNLELKEELILASDEEYSLQFREIFTEAVRCRLRSHTQPGTMLSGGLDSSSITCVAREIMNKEGIKANLPTFSAIFDNVKESDESPYINSIIDKGGYKPYYLHGDKRSPLTDIDKVTWHQDEPLFAFNLYLNTGLYEIAQKQGVKVILDGFDGDSTISHGTGHLRDLANQGKWLALYYELKGYAYNNKISFWKLQWDFIFNYGLNPAINKYRALRFGRRLWNAIARRIKNSSDISTTSWKTALNSNFIQQIDLEKRRRNQRKPLIESYKSQKAEHLYNLVRGVMPYTLEILDSASAANGVEVRFPFWDKRLIEFCLSLPPEQKIRNGLTRIIMRQALKEILSSEIAQRGGKSNLGFAFAYGLSTHESNRITSVLQSDVLKIDKYIDTNDLKKINQKFISQKTKDNEEIVIWKAINLELWLKKNAI